MIDLRQHLYIRAQAWCAGTKVYIYIVIYYKCDLNVSGITIYCMFIFFKLIIAVMHNFHSNCKETKSSHVFFTVFRYYNANALSLSSTVPCTV